MADWIDRFMAATEGVPSPPAFRLWTAITTIAGVLERRVYTITRAGETYPNLFVTLAGRSGHGKTQSINLARNLWAAVHKEFHLSSTDITPAAFRDEMAEAVRTGNTGSIFNALTVCVREFGTFFPQYDTAFLEMLSDLYDNPPKYSSRRRTSKSVNIENPTLNILAGVTPAKLGDMMPESAWGQGFAARMFFIFGHREEGKDVDFFKRRIDPNTTTNLLLDLRSFFELSGEFEWAESARRDFNFWFNCGMPPKPEHHRLIEYSTRRDMHVAKLSMISAVSAGRGTYIALQDFERAFEWLKAAETVMPDVFRAMGQKSHAQVIKDLYYHIYSIWQRGPRDKRPPVKEQELYAFLMERVESHQIKNIIDSGEKAGYWRKGHYPDEWTPRPMNEHAGL